MNKVKSRPHQQPSNTLECQQVAEEGAAATCPRSSLQLRTGWALWLAYGDKRLTAYLFMHVFSHLSWSLRFNSHGLKQLRGATTLVRGLLHMPTGFWNWTAVLMRILAKHASCAAQLSASLIKHGQLALHEVPRSCRRQMQPNELPLDPRFARSYHNMVQRFGGLVLFGCKCSCVYRSGDEVQNHVTYTYVTLRGWISWLHNYISRLVDYGMIHCTAKCACALALSLLSSNPGPGANNVFRRLCESYDKC